jgi:hypothetical protein
MSTITDFFSLLNGAYIWGFKQSSGRIISLEFGEPHLHVRAPKDVSHLTKEKHLIHKYTHRNVYPIGHYSLFIESGVWKVKTQNSNGDEKKALTELSGQILKNTTYKDNILHLTFDLGGELIINHSPSLYDDETETLWTLFNTKQNTHISFMHKRGLVPKVS